MRSELLHTVTWMHVALLSASERPQTRATFIRTYDGRRVVIPNAELLTPITLDRVRWYTKFQPDGADAEPNVVGGLPCRRGRDKAAPLRLI